MRSAVLGRGAKEDMKVGSQESREDGGMMERERVLVG